jgi:regulator of sigma E protease
MIMRRPISDRWKAAATRVGILLLLMLMSLAIFNDVRRLLS